MSVEKNRESWEAFAARYSDLVRIRDDKVHYGPNGPGEEELQLLGFVGGARVLELGCGSGHNTVALARAGADAVGIDFSMQQIRRARERAARYQVSPRFICADLDRLHTLYLGSFDRILSCFCSEYVRDLSALLSAARGILRPGGRLVLCDLHPFVSAGDVVGATVRLLGDTIDYFRRGTRSFLWDGATLVRHHRTMADLVTAFTQAGFGIARVIEPPLLPRSPSLSETCAYWDPTIEAQREVWERFPYTLIIVAEHHDSAQLADN